MQCEDCGRLLAPNEQYGGGVDWCLCAFDFFGRQQEGIVTDDGQEEDVFGWAIRSVRDRYGALSFCEDAAVGLLPGLEAG